MHEPFSDREGGPKSASSSSTLNTAKHSLHLSLLLRLPVCDALLAELCSVATVQAGRFGLTQGKEGRRGGEGKREEEGWEGGLSGRKERVRVGCGRGVPQRAAGEQRCL